MLLAPQFSLPFSSLVTPLILNPFDQS